MKMSRRGFLTLSSASALSVASSASFAALSDTKTKTPGVRAIRVVGASEPIPGSGDSFVVLLGLGRSGAERLASLQLDASISGLKFLDIGTSASQYEPDVVIAVGNNQDLAAAGPFLTEPCALIIGVALDGTNGSPPAAAYATTFYATQAGCGYNPYRVADLLGTILGPILEGGLIGTDLADVRRVLSSGPVAHFEQVRIDDSADLATALRPALNQLRLVDNSDSEACGFLTTLVYHPERDVIADVRCLNDCLEECSGLENAQVLVTDCEDARTKPSQLAVGICSTRQHAIA